jgi:radical SAM superfamily enzyme YgiQ (UPF0313 family)
MLFTSKGCQYHCSFCEEAIQAGPHGDAYYRRRSPENVLQELRSARERFNFQEVYFKDSVFAQDKPWLKEFLAGYAAEIAVPFKCFGKCEVFDEEIARLLKFSGCYNVEFGIQTFNQRLEREVLGRQDTTAAAPQAFGICDKLGLQYDADHLFGIPGETVDDHKDAARRYASCLQLNRVKCHNLTVYPDAAIAAFVPPGERKGRYEGDFFSHIAGTGEMQTANRAFQKLFKVLPLVPRGLLAALLRKDNWRWLLLLPAPAVVALQVLIALRHRDLRFRYYMRYYLIKLKAAFAGGWR